MSEVAVVMPFVTADDFYAYVAAVEQAQEGADPVALREVHAALLLADPRWHTCRDDQERLSAEGIAG